MVFQRKQKPRQKKKSVAGVSAGDEKMSAGRFSEAALDYQEALQALTKGSKEWSVQFFLINKRLGSALMELGRYAQALNIFEECWGNFSKIVEEKKGMGVVEEIGLLLQKSQAYQGMGMRIPSEKALKAAKERVIQASLAPLQPYLKSLEGKFEILQGRLTPAFRVLQEAAQEFESIGDLLAKAEVLLCICDPLIEHLLLKEANQIIQQVSSWKELATYPALAHAVHLRRLALGAFSGQWVQKDMELLKKNSRNMGRCEDWIKFWFHLSLAARRIGEGSLAQAFLLQAKSRAEEIRRSLSHEQGQCFLRRPDMARLWRLSRVALPSTGTAKVRAERARETSRAVEAGELAPPTRGK